MTDRRQLPFSGRIALDSLRGQIGAESFVPGAPAALAVPVADLCPEPGGLRDRQLVFGAALRVIDRRDGAAFVRADWDGYCGWLPEAALGRAQTPTHIVAAPASHLYREAAIRRGEVMALSMGARLTVTDIEGKFARTPQGYAIASHLRPLSSPEADPVAVAGRFLGVPYLWGGNSSAGIDCSGLVQLAFALCGRAVPGDSDMQWRELGQALPEDAPLRRGDLVFWKGHVALICDADTLIHANGHTMSVAHEPIRCCLSRIEAAGEGPFLGFRRP